MTGDFDAAQGRFKETIARAYHAHCTADDAAREGVVMPDDWPVLDRAAYHGIAGQIVQVLEPHTEADPVALLASVLAEVGTMLNRAPHLILDGSFHPLLAWFILIGQSSKSRKGTAGNRIETICALADPSWTRGAMKGTLSSGEGLAAAICDPVYEEKELKERGRPTGETVTICVEKGISDKRLFLTQTEFGAVLRVMHREGNSLSGVLRDAWDGKDLAPMTKGSKVRATAPHIGIIGHVTKDELLRNLTDTEASNGFGNRFIWLAVRRSKELPLSSSPDQASTSELAANLGKIVRQGRTVGEVHLTASARDAWVAVYHDLSADRPGLVGSLLGRAEAQVMRLAALYCVLDGHRSIDVIHLRAALALWEYAEASTRLIFGDSLGDPVADTILQALQTKGELSDSAVSELFGRHLSAVRLARSKDALLRGGHAHRVTVDDTGGRPRMVWRVGAKKEN